MKLIRSVQVDCFRSINRAKLDGLGNFSVLAGPNNAGKSNFLRALCAFFTDTCDGQTQQLDMQRDYYRPRAHARARKRIRVTVKFELPDSFRFRKGLEGVRDFLGSGFEITKEWDRDQVFVYLNGRELTYLDDSKKVDQFLSLIAFRYIPNRVLPIEVIRGEHEAVRRVIMRRLSRRRAEMDALFEGIRTVSQDVVGDISELVSALGIGVSKLRVSGPSSLGDLAFDLEYRLGEGSSEFSDLLQGSGIQSYLMLQTLHLVDKDYFQTWGWKQGAIWAVEEPESSMHTSLEARTAAWLRTVATVPGNRLQVLATSHSDLMVQYADRGYFVTASTSEEKRATNSEGCTPRELLERCAMSGTTRHVDALLRYPLEPLLIVEGKFDRVFVERALELMGASRECRVACLEDLGEGRRTGGAQDTREYIKHHTDAIRARPQEAPVIVVLDWDDRHQPQTYRSLLPDDAAFHVVKWPERQCNPRLRRSFKGIERFYSDRLIEVAGRETDAISRHRNGQLSVDPDGYETVKRVLADTVSSDLRAEDLEHAKPFLLSLVALLRKQPPQQQPTRASR
jgi:hypothetical protein